MRYLSLVKIGVLSLSVITALPACARPVNNPSDNSSLMAGVNGLKRIHNLINIYRKKHKGTLPPSTSALTNEMLKQPRDYGLKNTREALTVFTSPYSNYVDKSKTQEKFKDGTPYILIGKRFDGKPVGSPKPKGTRDVIAYTYGDLNYRAAATVPNGRASNPAGFYLVLWDDGKVQKIRQDQVLYVLKEDADYLDYSTAFRGQAGVPSKAKTYYDFYDKQGRMRAPK